MYVDNVHATLQIIHFCALAGPRVACSHQEVSLRSRPTSVIRHDERGRPDVAPAW